MDTAEPLGLVRYEAPSLLLPVRYEAREVPADWDYDKSVAVMAPRMRTWKSLTAEILSELYVAREALSKPHSNNSGWADYCKAIGVEKRTANRWLRRARMGTVVRRC